MQNEEGNLSNDGRGDILDGLRISRNQPVEIYDMDA